MDIAIAALQAYIYYLYFKTVEKVQNAWVMGSSAFNPGQQVIAYDYVVPVVDAWTEEAGEDWPWVSEEDYATDCYQAYDMQVMERAFSDTINEPLPKMAEYIDKAQRAQERLDFLQAIDQFMGLGGQIALPAKYAGRF